MKHVFLETHNIKNPYTGLGQFNANLLLGFQKVLTPEDNIKLHYYDMGNKKYQSLSSNNFKRKRYYFFHKHSLTSTRTRYDLWHSMNQNTKIEPHHKLPYLLTIHDVNFCKNNNKSRHENFKKKLARASAITYISDFVKKETHAHFKIENIPEYIIYNGNNIDASLLETPAHKEDTLYLFAIGDFLTRKNFDKLVQMMPFLPNLKLFIAGNNFRSYGKIVQEQIDKLQLNTRVILLGKISDIEKAAFYKGCHAFVTAGQDEGFCLPVIEAMSFGKPVFLYRQGALPEIGGTYANYWDILDGQYMADVITKYDRQDKSTYYSSEDIKTYAASFSWKKAAKEYFKVYQDLMNN